MAGAMIWDLPTRVFHWTLAAGFAAAAVIALGLDEDSAAFPYHALIGLTIALMVVLRVVWGLVGSRYARFATLSLRPRAVAEYLRGVATGRGTRHVGHNPASAYAIVAMFALLLTLAATGVMMGRGIEVAKGVHEACAYAMVAVVGAHVLGVILHTVRHRENIVASMVHGRKEADHAQGISRTHPIVAVVFVIVVAAWGVGLASNYDGAARATRVPVLGVALGLGEAEGPERESRRHDDERDD
ncbi:MAG: cytochrome b/b6 domain-containing protein [Phycisphaerae bacterium]|nr:cytochrome b/b6 domain-containing protein [Phycisphaerae bacterium]